MDAWTMVADARTDLTNYLETLSDQQWDAQSLCGEWRVRDVVGHVVESTRKFPYGALVTGMFKAGFNIDNMVATSAKGEGAKTPEQLLKAMREGIDSHALPPMTKAEGLLGDVVVHTQDIRRALGTPGSIPQDRLRAVLDYESKQSRFLPNKKRIAGVKLRATDLDWTTGEGPEAAGPGEALLMALCGRKVALEDLTGDGVAILRTR
jgi:uncharacterized protein (TIGR03083 family)